MAYHRLSGREYPNHQQRGPRLHGTRAAAPSRRGGIRADDIDVALASNGETLGIDRGELEEILTRAQLHAQRRRWAGLRCQDVISRALFTVGGGSPVTEAWQLLTLHRIKSLPVVTAQQQLVSIVSDPTSSSIAGTHACRPCPG